MGGGIEASIWEEKETKFPASFQKRGRNRSDLIEGKLCARLWKDRSREEERRGKVGLFFRERSNSRQSARYNPISVIRREGKRRGEEERKRVEDKKHRRANVHSSR